MILLSPSRLWREVIMYKSRFFVYNLPLWPERIMGPYAYRWIGYDPRYILSSDLCRSNLYFSRKSQKINIASLDTRAFFTSRGQRVYKDILSYQTKPEISTMENSRNVGGKKSLRRKRRCSVFRPCLCFNFSLLFQLDFWNGKLRCQGALWIFLCWERFSVLHPVMYQTVWSL